MVNLDFQFDAEEIETRLGGMTDRLDKMVFAVFSRQADLAESWMKQNARWTDRTGNARQGLSARVAHSRGVSWTLELFHRMSYGIWLEVRWAGRYSIIGPAIQNQGRELMETLEGLLDRLEARR